MPTPRTPIENPTPLTNFLQMILIFVIPAGLTYTFGRMVGDTRQGWAIFAAMAAMFLVGVFVCYGFEQAGNPILAKLGLQSAPTATQAGGNMEGKETRFGIASSALFATVTTDASCGAVNSFHDSFTPLGGLVPMFNIQTDEVIFGGVGSGLYGMLLYAIVAVFIAGLMVGRTPEYLGKKIQQKEVKMAMLPILATSFLILVFTAVSVVVPFAKNSYWNPTGPAIANLNNSGPHGFSEMLYAYSSASENNGSAFAGINANTPWYNLTTRAGNAVWALHVHRASAGRRGQSGREEEGALFQRHVSHARSPLCGPAGGDGDGRRRPDLLPGAGARPDGGAFPHARGKTLLLCDVSSLELTDGNDFDSSSCG